MARGLLFEGSILTYDPATNGTEWISVRGTINDLSPVEDASAQELSNITIPNSPEDAPRIDRFGEHQQEHIAEVPAEAFHAGIIPCEGEEVMEELPPDEENISSDSSKESDSDERTTRHCYSDSISQAEEEGEDREEFTEEPTEELAEEPTGELALGPTEGPTRELQWDALLPDKSYHLEASEKLKKEWSSMHQKKRLTACVEDLVGMETGIQEDYRGDGHGRLWLHKMSTHG